MKKFAVTLIILALFLFLPSISLAADICAPDVSVDSKTFNTSVTFDVSNQGLSDGSTVKLTLDKNLTYSTDVGNKKAVFNLAKISAGQHSFFITVRGQGLCTYQGKDSVLTVPDAGQGSETTIPWKMAAGRGRAVYCIQDPKGNFATKEQCEGQLRSFSPTSPPTPTPPPPPCKEITDPITNKKTNVCDTALGNFQTTPGDFVQQIFGIVLSLAGGVSVILIILSGYRFISSGGNPEKLTAAKEQLVSAIVGLLFIIFSLSILQIIGVDILHIPGLNP